MTGSTFLSVVVAVQYAQENLENIVRAVDPARHPDVEFIFCYTSADPKTPNLVSGPKNVSVLCAEVGSLIPHLWRDGIRAANGKWVAVTTAHCIPDQDWVERLSTDRPLNCAGTGGVIEIDPDSDSRGWAIYIQRYCPFWPPQEAREVHEIAADNAVYRRDEILRHSDLLENGFWEPSFHQRFADDGLVLRIDPTLTVRLRNGYNSTQFFGQRLSHGREFGLARGQVLSGTRRVLLLLLAPALPFLFLSKLVIRVLRQRKLSLRFFRAFPWLCLFVLAWTAGETLGYWASISRKGIAVPADKRDDR